MVGGLMRNLVHRSFLIILGTVFLQNPALVLAKAPLTDKRGLHEPDLSASVVRIEVAMQEPDYRSPWDAGRIEGGVGSGFIIGGKRILTNAHVVSNARFITLTREGISHPYIAHVLFIAHDCDLAILGLDDPSFFDGTRELSIGSVPEIESAVSVYGYPLGGERLSVTRGVVSRIDFESYSHSEVDSHLIIQIDAAINPGNSGGPVLQDGKVVGVAFQAYSGDVAQNVGFMIPPPVINRFLKDISKGSYTGYTDLSISYRELIAPASRKALGLDQQTGGILVTDVQEEGSSAGFLKTGDILIAIDGHPIASNGRVELDGSSVEMTEIVERKLTGDKVSFDIVRDGKPQKVEFTLQGTWPFHMQAHAYDTKPRYLIHGGLLFQPLDRNFMASISFGDLRLRRTFDDFVDRHLYLERPEVVVLSRVLADPVNKDCDGLHPGIIDTINGKKIRSLEDVKTAFSTPATYDVIILMGEGVPIALKREEVIKADPGILERYRIFSSENLTP
jgi:S1-C subfamily serine protease